MLINIDCQKIVDQFTGEDICVTNFTGAAEVPDVI